MRSELRFHPPHLELTPEIEWVLLRAYAPTESDVPAGSRDARADLAWQLGLSTRIAARFGTNVIRDELGENNVTGFADHLRQQTAYGLGLMSTEMIILEHAARLGAPIVLLKFAALLHLELVSVTSRPACDLDLLVRPQDIPELTAALEEAGFQRRALKLVPHQPVVLLSPSGVSIEFHVHLPYVRVSPDMQHATLQGLRDAQLLEHAVGKPEIAYVPQRSVVVAHLMAHAMIQHGFQPGGYPALRLLSDAVDMGIGPDDPVLVDASRWVERDLTQNELDIVARAAQVLAHGRVREVWSSPQADTLLIRHCIASMLNEKYRAQLRLRGVLQVVREQGIARTAVSYLGYAFALPEGNLKKIYPNSRLPPAITRVIRPADFLLRGAKVLWKATAGRRQDIPSGGSSEKPGSR